MPYQHVPKRTGFVQKTGTAPEYTTNIRNLAKLIMKENVGWKIGKHITSEFLVCDIELLLIELCLFSGHAYDYIFCTGGWIFTSY